MQLIFDFSTSHYGFPGSQERGTQPGSQERGTQPGSGFPAGFPAGFRVPRNGERIQVLGSEFSGTETHIAPGSRVSKNGEPARIRSPRSFENRVSILKNPSGFRVLGNGEPIVDFAFPGTEPETDTPN
jgi:hypothetical protein